MSATRTTGRTRRADRDARGVTTPRRPRIDFGSAGMSMTPEEFDAIPPDRWDDRFRYELIRGVLVVSPIAGIGERSPNDLLGHLLRAYQEAHAQGAALDETAPEQHIVGTPNRRRADRAIWTGLGRAPDVDKDMPSIVVEFVASRRRDALRDYEEKRDEYLAAGVREYWIIDRFRRIMTVYHPTPTGPTFDVVTEGQTYQTDRLPGFELPPALLFAKADALTKPKKTRRPRKKEGTA